MTRFHLMLPDCVRAGNGYALIQSGRNFYDTSDLQTEHIAPNSGILLFMFTKLTSLPAVFRRMTCCHLMLPDCDRDSSALHEKVFSDRIIGTMQEDFSLL